MKVLTVLGARPQFIKTAPVSRELRKVATEVLVHTGQHFDANMSDVFFEELSIPKPDYHFGIGGTSHAAMTGAMLAALEEVMLREQPDWVLVYGDTNSTLTGAIAAAKLHVPVAHVEAGLRSFNRRMPEEINRVLTDHISQLLFAPTETAVRHLEREGLAAGVQQVGDVMYDATLLFRPLAEKRLGYLESLGQEPQKYGLVIIHRAENTDAVDRLRDIICALGEAPLSLLMSLHPRTRKKLQEFAILLPESIRVLKPVGYLDMLLLESNALMVLTDSGGVQKEACFVGVPCITLREETEWSETQESGWNTLVGTDPAKLLAAIAGIRRPNQPASGFGDGRASERIIQALA